MCGYNTTCNVSIGLGKQHTLYHKALRKTKFNLTDPLVIAWSLCRRKWNVGVLENDKTNSTSQCVSSKISLKVLKVKLLKRKILFWQTYCVKEIIMHTVKHR